MGSRCRKEKHLEQIMMTILAATPQTGKVQPGESKSCQGDDEDEATAQEN